MRRIWVVAIGVAAGATAALCLAGTATAQQKVVTVGGMCDRTGPTQVNGVSICPAIQDYYDLVNSKGGVEGYKIRYQEIDHEYKVPPAVEAYEREKGDGATSIMVYGSPQVQANAFHICSRSLRPTFRRVRRRSSTSRTSSAAVSKAKRSPTSSTTTRRVASRSR